jgi:Zn-dependent protease with chaperone function
MKTKKVNIFAFPSQTAILFWLITITLVGAVAFGTSGEAPFPIWWLLPVLLFLTVWGFLARPDRDIRNRMLIPIGDQYPNLRASINLLSNRIGIKKTPIIFATDANRRYTMGSFRRWYIVLGTDQLYNLEAQLSNPDEAERAKAILLHELYHFKNGDYWQTGFLDVLFRSIFPLMLWFMFFFGGWMFLLALASQSLAQLTPQAILEKMPAEAQSVLEPILLNTMPSNAEMDAILAKAEGINFAFVVSFVFNISIPLILISIILLLFYSHLIWQMREYYADAGVAQTLGSSSSYFKISTGKVDATILDVERGNSIPLRFRRWISISFSQFGDYLERRTTPSGRTDALLEPQRVFYDWKRIALFLSGLVLILEIFLATPLTLPFIGQNPMHFSTVVVVVAVTYFLLPRLVLGKSGWLDAAKIILVVNGIRLAWLLLTLSALWGLYFVAPEYLTEVLKSAIYSIARYAGSASFDFDLLEFIVKASTVNLLQVPIIFIFQLLSTLSLTFLFGRMFKWYSYLATSNFFKKTVFILTIGVALILLIILLPISTAILTEDPGLFVQPIMVVQIVVGALILFGMAFWFCQNDKKYFGICPHCGKEMQQTSKFLENCSECGEVLYPWLWTEYDDE